jgi:hypothetical protein
VTYGDEMVWFLFKFASGHGMKNRFHCMLIQYRQASCNVSYPCFSMNEWQLWSSRRLLPYPIIEKAVCHLVSSALRREGPAVLTEVISTVNIFCVTEDEPRTDVDGCRATWNLRSVSYPIASMLLV